jgi:hypothetical protein
MFVAGLLILGFMCVSQPLEGADFYEFSHWVQYLDGKRLFSRLTGRELSPFDVKCTQNPPRDR